MRNDELLFNRYFEDWSKLSIDKQKSLLEVKSHTVLPSLKDLDLSKKMYVKFGIDPTGSEIHIGHLCPMLVLNLFCKLGHHIDFIIGDFTAKIGDPSGRVSGRPMITDEQVAKNFSSYISQVNRFIDTSKFKVHHNSTWLSKLSFAEILGIGQHINMSVLLQREDFRNRMTSGGLTFTEVSYGILQGYDSLYLESNVELCGKDQLLNCQQGREIQRIYNKPAQTIIATPILEGTDGTGRKMSKSYDNYIPVIASAEDKFGKIMSIPDSLLMQYYKCFGYLFAEEIAELEVFIKNDPMEAKKQLASYIVSIEAKDLNAGRKEREKFEAKFSKKVLVDNDFKVIHAMRGNRMVDVIRAVGGYSSLGEVKRLFEGNAVRDFDTGELYKVDAIINRVTKLKVGKMNYFKIELNEEKK